MMITDLIETNSFMGGMQLVYKFPNGYGASVIKHEGSYGYDQGLWEIAVLDGDDLCYSSPIANDVLGRLNDKEVEDTLLRIKSLV